VFRTLGILVARAILDCRTIDLPMSEVWWDLVFDRRTRLENIKGLNEELYRAL